MSYLLDLFSNLYILAALSVILTFLSSIRMFPVIIHIVRTKNIMDIPGGRKIHTTNIPTLGGIGLFASFSLCLIIFGISIGLERPDLIKLLSLLGATILLLFMGVKDDLIAISPKKKLTSQLIASAIVIFMTDVRIMSFNGLFGIGELPYIVSVLFTLFVFILVINAFNLIDGIDGLAGSIALIGCCTYGIFFLQNGQSLMSVVSFLLIGSILGFLRYNLSKSDSKKLFMGDSGSMFIGFLLAYQGISFLTVNASANIPMPTTNALIVLLPILSFPLLDTLRVFILRAKDKRSPFSPDRNHIHHRLLNLGLSHKQSTFFIVTCNWLVIGTAFLIRDLNINVQFLIFLGTVSALYLSPFIPFAEKLIRLIAIKEPLSLAILVNTNKEIYEPESVVPTALTPKPPRKKTFAALKIHSEQEYLHEEKSLDEERNAEIQKIMDKREAIFKKTSILK